MCTCTDSLASAYSFQHFVLNEYFIIIIAIIVTLTRSKRGFARERGSGSGGGRREDCQRVNTEERGKWELWGSLQYIGWWWWWWKGAFARSAAACLNRTIRHTVASQYRVLYTPFSKSRSRKAGKREWGKCGPPTSFFAFPVYCCCCCSMQSIYLSLFIKRHHSLMRHSAARFSSLLSLPCVFLGDSNRLMQQKQSRKEGRKEGRDWDWLNSANGNPCERHQ